MNANFWPRVDVLAGLSMAKYTLEDESNKIKNKNRIPNIFLVNEEKLKAYSEHSKDINSNKFIESQEHQEFKKKIVPDYMIVFYETRGHGHVWILLWQEQIQTWLCMYFVWLSNDQNNEVYALIDLVIIKSTF